MTSTLGGSPSEKIEYRKQTNEGIILPGKDGKTAAPKTKTADLMLDLDSNAVQTVDRGKSSTSAADLPIQVGEKSDRPLKDKTPSKLEKRAAKLLYQRRKPRTPGIKEYFEKLKTSDSIDILGAEKEKEGKEMLRSGTDKEKVHKEALRSGTVGPPPGVETETEIQKSIHKFKTIRIQKEDVPTKPDRMQDEALKPTPATDENSSNRHCPQEVTPAGHMRDHIERSRSESRKPLSEGWSDRLRSPQYNLSAPNQENQGIDCPLNSPDPLPSRSPQLGSKRTRRNPDPKVFPAPFTIDVDSH